MDTAMPDPENPTRNQKADRWSDTMASSQILAFIVIEIHKRAVMFSYWFPVISRFLRVPPASLGACGPLRATPNSQPVEKRVKNVFNTCIRVM